MAEHVALVDYLVLGDDPHLVAWECNDCGAQFFDRRNACASCAATQFERVRVAPEGILRTYTIVAHAAPEIDVPFVAGVVDCHGARVRANLVGVAPDPSQIQLGMKVRFTTTSIGLDRDGNEAIGFAFEPVEEHANGS